MRIAGLSPFGLGHQKPHHYWEMLRVFWENRDNLPYAWKVLKHGVCDGCSLTPRGLEDDVIPGTHLCLTRLRLLRLNTMPAAPAEAFENAGRLRSMDSRALRKLGRLAWPMLREKGAKGFRRLTWDEALDVVAGKLRAADPRRVAFYLTSRGLTNEVYYVAQKLARLLGTNHVDNAARLCHAASTIALKTTLGVGASTVSLKDWLHTDLLVLWGTNLANNQPVSMKYLYHAKKNGARVVVVNPFREPGLERYWIPSVFPSALFGTRFADEFYRVRVGGDVAFQSGVLKCLIEMGALDEQFIAEHTAGWPEMKASLDEERWPDLEAAAGLPRTEFERFARTYASAAKAIFIWSMGLTQHKNGVDNVKGVINLALARGMLGKPARGLVPIRGHSGVQGGSECGAVPDNFPGGVVVNEDGARRFEEAWGVPVPAWKGMACGAMLDAAAAGELELLYVIGGNFLETMPEPERMRYSLERLPLRVHQDIILNSSMLVDSGEATLLLPARTRYETAGGGTQTSTERRIRYSPFIDGHQVGEARGEWEILRDLGRRALDGAARTAIDFGGGDEVREEMDRVMPLYRGIAQLKAEGQSFQYGGERLLEGGVCPSMPAGRARFSVLTLPTRAAADGRFTLTTRRGTQFNSMIYTDRDALTGAGRHDVILATPDLARLGLRAGDSVVLENELGAMMANVLPGDVPPGTVIAHWPEANHLIARHYDAASGEPDYNATVTLRKA
jgi:molybdopterin-dependent oxidoreductase alpha subunit